VGALRTSSSLKSAGLGPIFGTGIMLDVFFVSDDEYVLQSVVN